MQRFLHDRTREGHGYPIIQANSITTVVGDVLAIDSSGFLAMIGTTTKVFGYANEDKTITSDNQTVAKYKILYVPAGGVEMVYGADQACTQTDIGAYADFVTVTTGAFQLNLAAGSTGQMLVLGFGPFDEGVTTTDVVVEVAEPQLLAFAQD